MESSIDRRKAVVGLGLGALGLAWLVSRKNDRQRYDVPEVSLAIAKALMDAGALVIDVRNKDAFDYRHLPPAVLIPLAVLRAGIPASLAQDKARQIVVYCNDGHFTGPEAAHLLIQQGFTKVANMANGIEGWAGAGYPLVKA